MKKLSIDVCLSPALFDYHTHRDAIIVVVDILRATSSICTAFTNGVSSIIPVESSEKAKEMKNLGYIVAAERNGLVLDFADFGNSPFNFSAENVKNKKIVYTTTNGTKTIHLAAHCYQVIIGSFNNNQAVADYLLRQQKDVVILCAGWKDKCNIEDTVYAGCLANLLLASELFSSMCDSTAISLDLWNNWKHNIRALIEKSAQRWRLNKNGLDDCIDYCLQLDTSHVIPCFKDNHIINIQK